MAVPVRTKPGWRFGVFEVDARKGELRRSGLPLKLREQSFRILLALLENPGEIVTRDELRRLLWPSDTFVDFDHSLNTAVMKLRDALGDSTEAPIYIETIPKRGYRFVAPVSSIGELANHQVNRDAEAHSSPDERTHADDPEKRTESSVRPYKKWLIVGALGLSAVAVAGTLMVVRSHRGMSSPADRGSPSYRIDSITTARGSFKDPAISPDGRDVAYAWNGGGGDHWDIYVHRIGTPMPHRLTYVKTGFVGFPAWSPDQTQIAFTRCNGVDDGVYIISAVAGSEEGPERKLTGSSCQYNLPTPVVWLPDSRILMIDRCPASGLHSLVLFSMNTGDKLCVADFGLSGVNRRFAYSVSPDQKTIAFIPSIESPTCEVYTVTVAGGSPRRIVEDSSWCDDVMWTPSGREIVVLSERTKFQSLWRVGAHGGVLRQESVYSAIGSTSKDGRRFVYAQQSNGEPQTIWRADLASPGGELLSSRKIIATQFPELDAQPSPDGNQLVWAERRPFIEEIWTGRSNGENPSQLTQMNTYAGTPRWSPDGKWIVFDAFTAQGPQIYIIDAAGRNLRSVTKGPYFNAVPSWSRDGRSIYFTSLRTGRKEVWKHLQSGDDIQLTKHGGFNPFESFDGQSVYFSKFDEAGIWKIPVNGGEESLVVKGRPQTFYWGHWALTRPGIYFLNADVEPRARIEFYDFATRRTFPVLSLEKNAVYGQPSLSATEDGKTIFYTQMDRQSVIKMMEFSR